MNIIVSLEAASSFSLPPINEEKRAILAQLVSDPSKLSEFQLAELHKNYPKIVWNAQDWSYQDKKKYWTPTSEISLFSIACRVGDQELIGDLIAACREAKCIEPLRITLQMISYDGGFSRFFGKCNDALIEEYFKLLTDLDPAYLFEGTICTEKNIRSISTKILHLMVIHGSLRSLEILISLSPDPKKFLIEKDSSGNTALHIAIIKGRSEQAIFLGEQLIKWGCPEALVEPARGGRTPLHVDGTMGIEGELVPKGLVWLVQAVRRHLGGAGLRKRSMDGTPLTSQELNAKSNLQCYKKLLIEDFIAHGELDALEESDARGNPPLFLYPDLLLEYFIEQKNHRALSAKNSNGDSFLHSLLEKNRENIRRHLSRYIDYCKAEDKLHLLWSVNNQERTPLEASREEHQLLLEIFRNHHPTILTGRYANGDSPLHVACKKGHLGTIQTIVSLYSDAGQLDCLFQADNNGISPIQEIMITHGDDSSDYHLRYLKPFFKALLGTDDLLEVAKKLYTDPVGKKLLTHLLFCRSLRVQPEGDHIHTGAAFARLFMGKTRIDIRHKTEIRNFSHIQTLSKVAMRIQQAVAPSFEELECLPSSCTEGGEKLGRTYFTQPKEDGFCCAFKIQKATGETAEQLASEPVRTRILVEEGLAEPNTHRPIGCYAVKQLPGFIKEKMGDEIKPGEDERYRLYHYEAPPAYFLYLHQSMGHGIDDNFIQAIDRCMAIRVAEMKQGLMPVTADIWHNRFAKLRFVPLADLLARRRAFNSGTGRLSTGFTNWEYPNERWEGPADRGDITLLSEILNEREKPQPGRFEKRLKNPVTDYISDLSQEKCGSQPQFYLLDALSQLYMTYSMLGIYLLYKEGQVNWQQPEKYGVMADYLKHVFQKLFVLYSEDQEGEPEADWTLMARQISFWVDNSPETGYYEWVKEGKLPEELFPNMKVSVQAGKYYLSPEYKGKDQFFREGLGTCEQSIPIPLPDFGYWAGPLAWTEFERSLYAYCPLSLCAAEHRYLRQEEIDGKAPL